MSKQTKTHKKTTSERITSYLSSRKTPAPASVVAERVQGKNSTIKRTLSLMAQSGVLVREPINAKTITGRKASMGYTIA